MQERIREGGCLCGAVRYTVRGEPFHVGRCHCADCRKRSGGAYTIYVQWPREAFE
ncbi:MAG TPA: GFA family protein [Gaiellaceae bacterium]|nr:GFA family protein [Gaiellaceae bacterium]